MSDSILRHYQGSTSTIQVAVGKNASKVGTIYWVEKELNSNYPIMFNKDIEEDDYWFGDNIIGQCCIGTANDSKEQGSERGEENQYDR